MARKLKPWVVDTVRDPNTRNEYEIFLDRNNLKFFAEHEGVKLTHETAREVARLLKERFKAEVVLNWQPVIVVSVGKSTYLPSSLVDGPRAYAQMDIGRRYLSPIGDEDQVVRTDWEVGESSLPSGKRKEPKPEEQLRAEQAHRSMNMPRNEDGTLALPYVHSSGRHGGGETILFIAYNEETWNALALLTKVIDLLGYDLKRMIDGQLDSALMSNLVDGLLSTVSDAVKEHLTRPDYVGEGHMQALDEILENEASEPGDVLDIFIGKRQFRYLDDDKAEKIHAYWSKTYSRRHPAKEEPQPDNPHRDAELIVAEVEAADPPVFPNQKSTDLPEGIEEEHLEYLDDLRKSAVTNMLAAAVYLREEFSDLSKRQSETILKYWAQTFAERHPAG